MKRHFLSLGYPPATLRWRSHGYSVSLLVSKHPQETQDVGFASASLAGALPVSVEGRLACMDLMLNAVYLVSMPSLV